MEDDASVNNIENWNIEDHHSRTALSDIAPMGERAWSLIARKQGHALLKRHFLQVAGVAEMIAALEYHHARFMATLFELQAGATTDEAPLRYEAVAYLNRVGQFATFATSDLVSKQIPNALDQAPKISEVLVLRHKHAAHRSIDNPRTADAPWLRTVHAMSLSRFGGWLFKPRTSDDAGSGPPHWSSHYAVFSTNMGAGGVFEFVPELDHPVIVEEAYSILENLLA